jgi:hypothetical protein
MIEEHKKMEEKKKIEEEEKAKMELELPEKIKEEGNKIPEKKNEIVNINAIDNNSNKNENQAEIVKEEIKVETCDKNRNKDISVKKTKENLNNNKEQIEMKNPKINKIANNASFVNNQAYIKLEVLKAAENLPTERKIKEKIELNNLLKNLNFVQNQEDGVNEQTEMNYEIPYYLTKEWVVKNLLS